MAISKLTTRTNIGIKRTKNTNDTIIIKISTTLGEKWPRRVCQISNEASARC